MLLSLCVPYSLSHLFINFSPTFIHPCNLSLMHLYFVVWNLFPFSFFLVLPSINAQYVFSFSFILLEYLIDWLIDWSFRPCYSLIYSSVRLSFICFCCIVSFLVWMKVSVCFSFIFSFAFSWCNDNFKSELHFLYWLVHTTSGRKSKRKKYNDWIINPIMRERQSHKKQANE